MSLRKSRKFLKTKIYSFVSIKMKNICRKKKWENLLQVWFASAFMQWASDSATPCTILPHNDIFISQSETWYYTRIDCIQDHFILKVMALSWRFTLDCNRVLAGSCRNNSLISIKIRTNSNSFLSKSTSVQKCPETQNGRIYWSGGI